MKTTGQRAASAAEKYLQIKGHVPALDGLRGLAILLVLFHHLWPWEWSTRVTTSISKLSHISWFGVDLFFVLSGFLITGILLDSRKKAGYFKNFILRRTLRIFPAYFLFLGICFFGLPLVLSLLGIQDVTLESAKRDMWWYFLYVSNYLWIPSDPVIMDFLGLGPAREIAPTVEYLGLTWSLAVEEQFYLIWPLIVFFFSRKLHRPIVIVLLFSIALRLFLLMTVQNWSAGAYMSSLCRADSLVLGAAMAHYCRSTTFNPVTWNRFAAIGLYFCLPLSILYQTFVRGPGDPFFTVIGYTITALGFAGLLATVVRRQSSSLRSVVESRTLAWFGKYSYGIYLYHMLIWHFLQKIYNAELKPDGSPFDPALFSPMFGNILIDAPIRMMMVGALTMLLAWLSFKLYEQRFLHLKKYFS
jgi:peptidoglycan/LPS O-acetylase OafA/YrhL